MQPCFAQVCCSHKPQIGPSLLHRVSGMERDRIIAIWDQRVMPSQKEAQALLAALFQLTGTLYSASLFVLPQLEQPTIPIAAIGNAKRKERQR